MSIYSKPVLRDRRGGNIGHGPKLVRNPRTASVERAGNHLVGANGEYNAISKEDLFNVVMGLMQLNNDGQAKRSIQVNAAAAKNADEMLRMAQADTRLHGGAFERLGQVVVDSIQETGGRLGFTDKVMARIPAEAGKDIRIPINRQDVICWHMVDGGNVAESVVSPKVFYPDLYYLNTLLVVEDGDLFLMGQKFLEDKLNAGLVATMVREDNASRFMFDQAASVANTILSFGSFTPTSWVALRYQVERWNLHVASAIIASDLWQDITADTDWHGIYSPIEQHTLFEEGRFGRIYDTEIFTDGSIYDNLRVLEPGEVYLLSSPATLGGKAEAIPLTSKPIEKYQDGRPARGYFIEKYQTTFVGNSKGVSKGIKI